MPGELACRLFATLLASSPAAAPVEPFRLQLDVPSVLLFPVVYEKGRYVRDLGRKDLLLFEDGRPIEIDAVESEGCSLSVALLIDLSDSMADKLERVQEASARFVSRLGPEDRVAVFGFSRILRLGVPLTTDHEAAQAAVFAFPTGGGTAMLDAVEFVAEKAFAGLGRNVIVVFTDGRDRTSNMASRVARLARSRSVIIYTLSVPEPNIDAKALHDLHELGEGTGGQALPVPRLDRVDRLFDDILEDLRAQYRVSFTPRAGPPGERKIELRARHPGYTVRCRESYRYP